MAIQSDAWEQVGENFEALGQHMRSHFDEVAAEAAAERAAFEKSVRGLLTALEDGFGAAGKAIRDPMLRDDVTNVATAVREALLSTFETAGDQVRERLAGQRPATRPAAKRAPATKRAPAARKATSRDRVARKPAQKKQAPARRAAG